MTDEFREFINSRTGDAGARCWKNTAGDPVVSARTCN